MDILATHDLCYLDNINVIVCDHVLGLAIYSQNTSLTTCTLENCIASYVLNYLHSYSNLCSILVAVVVCYL